MYHFLGQCEKCEEIEDLYYSSPDGEELILSCANCGGNLIRKTSEEIKAYEESIKEISKSAIKKSLVNKKPIKKAGKNTNEQRKQ